MTKNFFFLDARSRLIIRDLTGRYAWDTKLEPKISKSTEINLEQDVVQLEQYNLRQQVSLQPIEE